MKRFIAMIVAVCAFFAASAQHPLVTLSHNGELSFFTSLRAFEAAIDSAKNGDTIYLSEGDFILADQVEITKRVSIVGCGYRSHILGTLGINMAENPNSCIDAPLLDGIRLETLQFNTTYESSNNLDRVEIRNSRIRNILQTGFGGNNVVINSCCIERLNCGGVNNGSSILAQNSKIYTVDDGEQHISIRNCNLGKTDYCPRNVINSIIHEATKHGGTLSRSGTHIVKNSLFTGTKMVDMYDLISGDIVCYDCYFDSNDSNPILDENLDCTLNLLESGYLGDDGTVVGVQGGEFPFSENPSVPTVDTTRSSVTYDAEGDKLKVDIILKVD